MGKEVLIGRLRQTPERVDDDVREVDVFLNLEVLEAGEGEVDSAESGAHR